MCASASGVRRMRDKTFREYASSSPERVLRDFKPLIDRLGGNDDDLKASLRITLFESFLRWQENPERPFAAYAQIRLEGSTRNYFRKQSSELEKLRLFRVEEGLENHPFEQTGEVRCLSPGVKSSPPHADRKAIVDAFFQSINVEEAQKVLLAYADTLGATDRAILSGIINGLTHEDLRRQLGLPKSTMSVRVKKLRSRCSDVLTTAVPFIAAAMAA